MRMLAQYDGIVRKVCFMYSSERVAFDDLYQETMTNLWRGFDGFRQEASLSTWIYRVTVNTCISFLRRNKRHASTASLDEAINVVAGDDADAREDLRQLYAMISTLNEVDKALVMLWLDGNSYDEIADVTGISRANVATKLFRIKNKLRSMSDNY